MTYTDCPNVDAPSDTSRCLPVPTTTENVSTPPTTGPTKTAGAPKHGCPTPAARAYKTRRRRKKRLHQPVTGARSIQRIGRRTGRRTLVEKRQPIHAPLVRPLARED